MPHFSLSPREGGGKSRHFLEEAFFAAKLISISPARKQASQPASQLSSPEKEWVDIHVEGEEGKGSALSLIFKLWWME